MDIKNYMENARVLIEALPYIKQFSGQIVVVKYGGSAMTNEAIQKQVIKDIALMKLVGIKPVLVHGGGKEITQLLKRMGVESRFDNGLRITDKDTMNAAQMVLAGKINKDIVSMLEQEGIHAAGICGHDGDTFHTKKYMPENKDIGFVGEISKVKTELIQCLAQNDFIPVIAPIGTDKYGNSYNINADFAAAAVAEEIKAKKLIFLSDIEGVYGNDAENILSQISIDDIPAMIADGTIQGGMIPKLNCCKKAVEAGVGSVHIIDGRLTHSLLLEIFTDCGIGTMIQ